MLGITNIRYYAFFASIKTIHKDIEYIRSFIFYEHIVIYLKISTRFLRSRVIGTRVRFSKIVCQAYSIDCLMAVHAPNTRHVLVMEIKRPLLYNEYRLCCKFRIFFFFCILLIDIFRRKFFPNNNFRILLIQYTYLPTSG